MTTPRVTVVTPSFNQGRYIERTIESVLSQGYPNLEYIIIDGGSTDQSLDVIRKYEKQLAFWVSEKDRGQSHALNKGFERATGSYVTWLNSDDWFEPGALATFTERFRENPESGMIVGAGQIVDLDGNVVHDIPPPPRIDLDTLFMWMEGNHFSQPSSMFTRAALQAAGPIDETVHISLDFDLWIRMAKSGVKFTTTPELISRALSHPEAKTTAFVDLMDLDCAMVLIRHGGEKYARKQLEHMVRKYSWYRRNYEAIVTHPLMRLLRPLVKRVSKEGQYWSEAVPPWVKK